METPGQFWVEINIQPATELDERKWQHYAPHGVAFADLWDSLNAGRGFGWEVNPWVAAYSFTVHRRNIDSMARPA